MGALFFLQYPTAITVLEAPKIPIDRQALREVIRSQWKALSQESVLGDVRIIELDPARVGRLSRAEAMQDHQMALEMAQRTRSNRRRAASP